MFLIEFALACGLMALGPSAQGPGVIRGRVVNMSQRETPCGAAEVILRARVGNEFAPVATVMTEADGSYRFEGLPVGPEHLYLPGANRSGIHYPGRRVGLTQGHPTAYVTLEVRDAVTEPTPLVIRQHEIVIGIEPEAIHVTEAMLVDNPTAATYVGRAEAEGANPVTMRLRIPEDFERVTFEKERFGREFQIVADRLETGIPWTPGRQWVRFTYTLRNRGGPLVWQRPLDAPCESVRVRVKCERSDEIACNLQPAADGLPGEPVFHSAGAVLPAGHDIRVRLGNAPVPWPVYARWAALLALAGTIGGTALSMRLTHRAPKPAVDALDEGPQDLGTGARIAQPKSGRSRRRGPQRRAA